LNSYTRGWRSRPEAGEPGPSTLTIPPTLAITIDSARFGTLTVEPADVLELPQGLIGLGGRRYTLLDRNPGTGFQWLHSLDDPALALPVVDPRRFFRDFALALSAEDEERVGAPDLAAAELYVTVRTAPDPADVVVNLRAPIVVWERRGYQLLNTAPGADLQVRLFASADAA
jgi:flagellar assembly factor FliW